MIVYVHIRFLHKRPVSIILIQYKSKLADFSLLHNIQWLLLVVRSLVCPTQLSLSAYDSYIAIYTLIPGGAASAFNLWVV